MQHLPYALVFFLLLLISPPASAQHPLDPLTPDEIIGAAVILLEGGAAIPGAPFQSVSLAEPAKADVLAGAAVPR